MYNNLHYNEPVSLTIQNWHWRNNEKFLPFVTFLTRFKQKFTFFLLGLQLCTYSGQEHFTKEKKEEWFQEELELWSSATNVGIWPWLTKSILFNLKQQRIFSGNSSGFWACMFFLTRKNIREGKSCNSLKVHQQFMIRFRLPELLSRDS